MTAPEQAIREGRLSDALAEVQAHVRNDPQVAKHRILLFQLFAILGEWDRALTQLQVIGELDAGTLAMVHTYRQAILAEKERASVFAGQSTPRVFGEPHRWVALLSEALRLTAESQYGQATELREQAFELAETTAGSIDQIQFNWISDADPRLGPVLETIINGCYHWLPFSRIQRLSVEAPTDLRDLVWTPVHFVWANGGEGVGFVPTRYTGSESQDDPQVRLSRRTEWFQPTTGSELFFGIGQRMLATDVGEFAIMDVRHILLETPEDLTQDDVSVA